MSIRYVTFLHPVQPPTVRALINTLHEQIYEHDAKSIYLLMATPGGSVDEGIMLFNAMRALPVELITHNIGNVDSIGNVIFLAGSKRRASANATFMWHGIGFDIMNPQRIEMKNAKELLSGIEAHTARMSATIAGCTNLTTADIHDLFLQQSTKDAAYAKAHGLIHEIAEAKIPQGASLVHAPAS